MAFAFALLTAAGVCAVEPATAPRVFQPTGPVESLAATEAAKPLVTNRPIFLLPAPLTTSAAATSRATPVPAHRRALIAAPTKAKDARTSGGKGAATTTLPAFGISNTPVHRRALGW